MTRFFLWLGEEKWLQFKSAVWENNLVVLQKGKHRICPNTLFFCCLVMSRRRQWRLTPVLLPGKSHGRRSLEGCSPCGRWGSDTTERLHFHFSLSCIGEEMATHSSVLAWRIPGAGKSVGLLSMGPHRVGHDWSNLAAAAAAALQDSYKCFYINEKMNLGKDKKSVQYHILSQAWMWL